MKDLLETLVRLRRLLRWAWPWRAKHGWPNGVLSGEAVKQIWEKGFYDGH